VTLPAPEEDPESAKRAQLVSVLGALARSTQVGGAGPPGSQSDRSALRSSPSSSWRPRRARTRSRRPAAAEPCLKLQTPLTTC